MHSRYYIAPQPNFNTGATEYWLGENVPVRHHDQVIGHHGEHIAGPFASQDAALDALAEISTPAAIALEAELA